MSWWPSSAARHRLAAMAPAAMVPVAMAPGVVVAVMVAARVVRSAGPASIPLPVPVGLRHLPPNPLLRRSNLPWPNLPWPTPSSPALR